MDVEILDMEDIVNLKDICDMYTYMISKCNLSADVYKIAIKTSNNLKKLLTDLEGLASQPK